MTSLRQRAEAFLDTNPEETPTVSTADVKKLIHELGVHQIELEIQNEELRRAQTELAESRDTYAELYDFAPVGYLTLDRGGVIREANLTAATLLGVERGSLLRRKFAGFVARDAQDEWHRFRRHALQAGDEKRAVEMALEPAGGAAFFSRIECRPRPGKSDRDWRCLMILSDVTERRTAEDLLAHQHELLEGIFENIPVLLTIWHPCLGRFRFNRHAQHVLGWTEADARDGDLMALIYPDPAYRAEVAAYMRTLEPGWREWVGTTRSGERVPIDWANIRLSDDTRIGIGVDLRERKRAEETLRRFNEELERRVETRTAQLTESEARFRAIFEQASDGIILADIATRRVQAANRAACKLLGYSEKKLCGMGMPDLHPAAALPRIVEMFERQKRGEQMLATDVPLRRRDGKTLYADIHAFPLILAGRQCLAGIFRDTTDHRQAERLRIRQEKQLRHLAARLVSAQDEEQRRIAEGLHDDVAQVLAACSLKLSTAERATGPAAARQVHDDIDALLQDAGEKVRLLSFELSSSTLYRLGLREAIHELCDSMSARYGVRFQLVTGARAPDLDEATATVLFKAARELLFNVVKHAQVKAATVRISGNARELRLAVEEKGAGFSSDPDGEDADDRGLGLFAIRERLKDVGGRMRIVSKPNVRTCVTLTVPLGSDEAGGGGTRRMSRTDPADPQRPAP